MSGPLNALDVCVLVREKYLALVKMLKSTNILKVNGAWKIPHW